MLSTIKVFPLGLLDAWNINTFKRLFFMSPFWTSFNTKPHTGLFLLFFTTLFLAFLRFCWWIFKLCFNVWVSLWSLFSVVSAELCFFSCWWLLQNAASNTRMATSQTLMVDWVKKTPSSILKYLEIIYFKVFYKYLERLMETKNFWFLKLLLSYQLTALQWQNKLLLFIFVTIKYCLIFAMTMNI